MIVKSTETNANAELVLSAIEQIFNQHDLNAIDEFFSDRFVQHSPYVPAGGRRELSEWWKRTVDAIPDLRGSVDHVVAGGNQVAVFRTLKGTIRKDMPDLGITARNQLLEFGVGHLFQVEDGKIGAHWEVMDSGPAVKLASGVQESSAGR
jgi:predicted SnoaL-like aldol condensation-catalyzing enzyme